MGSGFIIGGIWGLIVSAGALAVASLIGEPPVRGGADRSGLPGLAEIDTGAQTRPTEDIVPPIDGGTGAEGSGMTAGEAPEEAVAVLRPEAPSQPEPEAETAEAEAAPGDDAPPPVSAQAPQAPRGTGPLLEAPQAPSLSADRDALPSTPRADVPAGRGSAPRAETAPETRPEAGDAVETPGSAPQIAAAPEIETGAEEPVLPGPQSRVIEIPAEEADISVVTDPPPPPSQAPREVVEAESAAEPETGARPETGEAPGRIADTGAEVEVETPAEPEAEIAGLAPRSGPPATAPIPPVRPQILPGGPADPEAGTITVLPEDDARALPGRSAGLSGGDAVPVRRPGAEDEAEAPEADPQPEDAPAYLRFAAPDLEDPAAPRLSVVLVDDGALDDPVTAASSIPFQVTIGIDPEVPGAAERAARWRAAGYEIAALARLPARATPSDVEVTYESAFGTLPEAVALLDAGGAGLTIDGDVTRQALDRLARDGRGLVALSQGLATPLRQAREEGVPAVEVYRDLSEVGQDDRVIRRFLDQAAFRARQQGAVTLLADLNPETITALTLWGNRVDREGVAPAPVSALLQSQMTGGAK